MKILILMGSPRKQGNTAALLRPFRRSWSGLGAETETIWLYDQDILPCVACRTCQRDWTVFGCARWDDVRDIFDLVLGSGMIVLGHAHLLLVLYAAHEALLDRWCTA